MAGRISRRRAWSTGYPYDVGVRVGVCSWSLVPSGPEDLASQVRACGLEGVQLALDPIRSGRWREEEVVVALARAGVTVLSGMMATAGEDYSTLESIRRTGGLWPDELWPANLRASRENAALARGLGIPLVTFHAGFLPDEKGDRRRGVMLDRVRMVADVFAREGVVVALETGQETASTLAAVLMELDHPSVGVNFDPANMILYGMGDPVGALEVLGRWVRQVHVKDAVSSLTPGEWGTETRVGEGVVDWTGFFGVLRRVAPGAALVIEREGGQRRVEDVRLAGRVIGRYLGS
jgi:L-ribulose-5-phosphate 3-epimerase